MKSLTALLAFLLAPVVSAFADGLVITSVARTVVGGDPVTTQMIGRFATNSVNSFSWNTWDSLGAISQEVDRDVHHDSTILTTSTNLTVTGSLGCSSSGFSQSTYHLGPLSWIDYTQVSIAFSINQPFNFSLSATSSTSDFPGISSPGKACYASISSVGAGGVLSQVYTVGSVPLATQPGPIFPSGTNTGVLEPGNYILTASVKESPTVGTTSMGSAYSGGSSLEFQFNATDLLAPRFHPDFTARTISGQSIVLEFLTKANSVHHVEYSDTLGAGALWHDLTTVTGTGSPMTVTDPLAATGNRFYRIQTSY